MTQEEVCSPEIKINKLNLVNSSPNSQRAIHQGKKLLVWNRLPRFDFVLVFFSILIIVIFCHLSLLCLKMALDGLKLVAAIKILQSRMLFEIRFCASFNLLNYRVCQKNSYIHTMY